jgi:hypothetical protein
MPACFHLQLLFEPTFHHLIAFLAAMIDGIMKLLDAGAIFDWPHLKPILIAGISAALSYLLKSLMTNSRNQLLRKEPG